MDMESCLGFTEQCEDFEAGYSVGNKVGTKGQ